MKTWAIRIGIAAGVIIVLVAAWRMDQCRRKAKRSGNSFRCKLFNSEPIYRQPQREYYKVDEDGKCQKIVDYGNRMTFREVGIQYCK